MSEEVTVVLVISAGRVARATKPWALPLPGEGGYPVSGLGVIQKTLLTGAVLLPSAERSADMTLGTGYVLAIAPERGEVRLVVGDDRHRCSLADQS